MKRVAIFASGSGSNAENIIKYFEQDSDISIPLIVSNKEDAYVHERAKYLNIESTTFQKKDFESSDVVVNYFVFC